MTQLFSFPKDCPDEALLSRWESLLGKAPRLLPWLDETLRGRRAELSQKACGGEVERILWTEMSRWLSDFEALPSFAVSAIATTLEEKREPPPIKLIEKPAQVSLESPETALTELLALASDPAFALAHHCVEARIRPHLNPLLPAAAWFGLLHASAQANPQLSATTAVALVLRVSSREWQAQPSEVRRSAMRLFQATPADLRAAATLHKLCAPFGIPPERLPELVATSARLRKALPEAAALCAGLVARLRRRPGGLSLLGQEGASPATDAEVAELRESARRHTRMAGYARLLKLV